MPDLEPIREQWGRRLWCGGGEPAAIHRAGIAAFGSNMNSQACEQPDTTVSRPVSEGGDQSLSPSNEGETMMMAALNPMVSVWVRAFDVWPAVF